jgi:hypothetical protein
VQLADGAQSADPNEILAHVTGQLADYKVPESLHILHQIPRNATGKIDRQLLFKIGTGPKNPGSRLNKQQTLQVLSHQVQIGKLSGHVAKLPPSLGKTL